VTIETLAAHLKGSGRYALALFALAAQLSCRGAGLPLEIQIIGVVSDNTKTIPGALVSTNGASTITNSMGAFGLEVVAPSARVVLQVTAAGYAPNSAIVFPKPSVYHYERGIVLSAQQSVSIDPAVGGSLTVLSQGRPVTITLPAGAVQASGQVTIDAAGYDANSGPGALDTTGAPGQNKLQTQGMIHFSITDASGAPVAFAPGSGAKIGLQNVALPSVTGAQDMQQWQLNDNAQWDTPAPTTSSATGMNLLAQKQGYWNADRAYQTACIIGHAQAPNMTCGGAHVQADGPDGISTQDTTAADGTFCVEGAQGLSSTVGIATTSRAFTMPAKSGNCATASSACQDVGLMVLGEFDCAQGCPIGSVDAIGGCQAPSDGAGTECQTVGAGVCNNGAIFQSCVTGDNGDCTDTYYLVGTQKFDCGTCVINTNSSCVQASVAACGN